MPGAARLDDPAPGLSESPLDPGLPARRPRFPAEEHAAATRPHVRLDEEALARPPHERRQVDPAAPLVLARPGAQDTRPGHRAAQEPPLARSEERGEFGAHEALEEALLAELGRDARKGGAGVEAVQKAVEAPARRLAEVLETEVAVDDVDGEIAEPHAVPPGAELPHGALLGPDPGGAERRDEPRDLAVAVDGRGIFHERDSAEPPPAQPPGGHAHPAHDEGQEIRRIGEAARFPGGEDARKHLRAQDPHARGVVVQARERRGVRLVQHGLEHPGRSRLEPDVGADHELPGHRSPGAVARDPRGGGGADRAQSAEAADVVQPEPGRVHLHAVDEVGQPRETGQVPAAHEERGQRDGMGSSRQSRTVAMEERRGGLGGLHRPEQRAPAGGAQPDDPRRGQRVERRHRSRIIGGTDPHRP